MELSQYLHACLFSPTTSTLHKAIKKGFLKTFPGLTTSLVKHLLKSIATAQGHLTHEQGFRSTTKPRRTLEAQMKDIKE